MSRERFLKFAQLVKSSRAVRHHTTLTPTTFNFGIEPITKPIVHWRLNIQLLIVRFRIATMREDVVILIPVNTP